MVDLLDAFLSLLRQRPDTQEHTTRPPEGKALFRAKTDGGFGVFLGCLPLLAALMEEYRKNKATFHVSPPVGVSPHLARVPPGSSPQPFSHPRGRLAGRPLRAARSARREAARLRPRATDTSPSRQRISRRWGRRA